MNVSVRSKSIDSTSQNNEIVTIPEEMEELEEIESLDEEDNDSDVTEDLSDDGDEHFVDDDGTGSRQDLAEDTDTLSQAANSDSHCRTAVSETTSATYINGSSYLSLDDLKSPIWPSLFSEGEATLYFPTPDEKRKSAKIRLNWLMLCLIISSMFSSTPQSLNRKYTKVEGEQGLSSCHSK